MARARQSTHRFVARRRPRTARNKSISVSARKTRPVTLTHLNPQGAMHMVDVGEKAVTRRTAVASTRILMRRAVLDLIMAGKLPKGEALAAARLAGIQVAKRTGEWIPLCHPLPLESVEIEFVREGPSRLAIFATARTSAKTGVEMEALAAVTAAALTLYDMAKGADKGMVIGPTQLELKTGGRSGEYRRTPSVKTRRTSHET